MKQSIYYFSGTGNSLWVAQHIAEKVSCLPVSIATLTDDTSEIRGESIGIVCPIYMHNIPHMVVRFLKRLKEVKYLYLIVAGAGDLGHCEKRVKEHLTGTGVTLSAFFNLPMPSNYTNYGCPELEEQKATLEKAAKQIVSEIVPVVLKGLPHFDKNRSGFFHSNVHPAILYKLGYSRISMMDSSFSISGECSGCGVCARVCPAHNITMVDGKPQWAGGRCEQCYGCLHWCPKEAIEKGKDTVGVSRYHHPEIRVGDIIEASGNEI